VFHSHLKFKLGVGLECFVPTKSSQTSSASSTLSSSSLFNPKADRSRETKTIEKIK